MNRSFQVRLKIFILAGSVAFGVMLFATRADTQSRKPVETASQKFKSIKVLNDMPADQMGKVMNMISASLGVNCGFCHASDDGDYEKEGFEHKDIARRMMRMVFDLNRDQFEGRQEVNCNTCHNGRPHPRAVVPLGHTTPSVRKALKKVDGVTVDSIVAKFENAIGGVSKLSSIKSMTIRSVRLEPDGKTSEPETIYLKGDKYATDLFYGTYLVREVFDGTTSSKFGNTSAIDLKPDEAEQIKRDAQLFIANDLRLTYPTMEYRGTDTIDGREVHLVTATTSDKFRDQLAFDVETGFLVRRSSSTPTILGNFVYQVDHSDYKNFGGIKLPSTTRYSLPHIGWTRRILESKINVPVSDEVFGAPAIRR